MALAVLWFGTQSRLVAAQDESATSQPAVAQPAEQPVPAGPTKEEATDAEKASVEGTSAKTIERELSETPRAFRLERGTLFHPSEPSLGKFRFGIGGMYDAIDPQTIYDMAVRLPRLALDARLGLGKGFSLIGHLDTILIWNEITMGPVWATHHGPWSVQLGLQAGALLGVLENFGFSALYKAPVVRPQVTLGYAFGDTAISLRFDAIIAYPQSATVGDISHKLTDVRAFTGWSATAMVENILPNQSIWYYGVGILTTHAYYQMWLLFPDDPGLYTYVRLLGGYAF